MVARHFVPPPAAGRPRERGGDDRGRVKQNTKPCVECCENGRDNGVVSERERHSVSHCVKFAGASRGSCVVCVEVRASGSEKMRGVGRIAGGGAVRVREPR